MKAPTAAGPLRAVRGAGGTINVALVIPLQGPAGMFGPSCELCAELAAEELNATGGVLGRELRLVVIDGGAEPARVAEEVAALVSGQLVDAVTGWHISAVRKQLAPRIAGRVPYVYTALYEGGERTPGVFITGETPSRQLLPAMSWMSRQLGIRRWMIVGDDYVWPRVSAAAAQRYARRCGGEVTSETFVRLGTADFTAVVREVERSSADGVLLLLVGEDAVHFNRNFAAAGLDGQCVRLSPLMEENMLLASGADTTRRLFAAAGYFEALPTAGSMDFNGRYSRRFGPDAPMLNSLGESCYEGVWLLAQLIARAGTLDVEQICARADRLVYDSPRGSVRLRGAHLDQQVYLAQAVGLDFDVLAAL